MQKTPQRRILMDEDGICITTKTITTSLGDFPFKEIEAVEKRVRKPVWGPLLLGFLGTINLAIASQTAFWLDFAASGLMLGAGLYWWTQGTKYVLTLKMPRGDVDAWFARRESQLKRALNIIQGHPITHMLLCNKASH